MVIACVFLQIWRADLRLPFYYEGDAAFYAMSIKGSVENGWYWQNPALGAPGTQELYDFPAFDNAVVIFMLLLSFFTHNPFLITNLSLLAFVSVNHAHIFIRPSAIPFVLLSRALL